jgi:hypothetical protein
MPDEATQMRGGDQCRFACEVTDQTPPDPQSRRPRGGKALRLNELGFRAGTSAMKTSPAKNLQRVTGRAIPTPASHTNLSQPFSRALKNHGFESQGLGSFPKGDMGLDIATQV